MERTLITVPNAIPMVAVVGPHDANLRTIEAAFPSVNITVRGNEITLRGPHVDCGKLENLFNELMVVIRSGNILNVDAVTRAIEMLEHQPVDHPAEVMSLNIVSNRGRTIRPKTANQKRYVDAIEDHTITFGIGPAGTGKTLAAQTLVKALNKPYFYFNLGATQDPRGTLIGNTHFNQSTGTYFADSTFIKALQTENAVILLDEFGRIEWSNQAASDHLGIDPRRDVRQYVRNLVRSPAFAAYVAKGDFSEAVLIEGPNASPDALSEISIQMHPYGDARHLLLSNDVTALKRAESMRRDFVANVSHEIRTPLTVIRGFVETLQSLQLSEVEQRHYLELMGQQAARMDTLVVDLLTLSKLEGSPLPNVGEWLDAEELCSRVVSDARALSAVMGEGEQNVTMTPLPGYRISGLRSELLSAMGNLLSNAVRYTPVGGDIQAGWQLMPDGGLAFVVRDTGGGIAPEHLPRLTERFYRVDRSRSRETGGTGLGLAIVKHVAQRHGGELRIESTLGKGSEFVIQLPARRVKRS